MGKARGSGGKAAIRRVALDFRDALGSALAIRVVLGSITAITCSSDAPTSRARRYIGLRSRAGRETTSWSRSTTYRDRRRPFRARERLALQQAVPALANAVRNCQLLGGASSWEAALGALLDDRRAAAFLVEAPETELARTPRAATLIERWFAPHERRAGGLPAPLAALVARMSAPSAGAAATWSKRGDDASLTVSLLPLPGGRERARGLLLLEQRPYALPLPPDWCALLTPAERQVCAAVLRGWDNRLVAGHVGCAEATVKKHLQSVFDKLGIPSRAALIARAADARGP